MSTVKKEKFCIMFCAGKDGAITYCRGLIYQARSGAIHPLGLMNQTPTSKRWCQAKLSLIYF
jgi:hypothetical protein